MTAGSFSGCHPFRNQCLREQLLTEWPGYHRDEYGDDLEDYVAEREADPDDQAVVITSTIDAGRCPRCDELFPADRLPAGSRVTACRCIPVCPACGDHEALVVMPAISWPWPAVHIREQGIRMDAARKGRPGHLHRGNPDYRQWRHLCAKEALPRRLGGVQI